MEIIKTKTATLSQKPDSLEGKFSPAMQTTIKNGSNMSEGPSSTHFTKEAGSPHETNSHSNISAISRKEQRNPSPTSEKSAGWRSSSPGAQRRTQIRKMSSEVSRTHYSPKTKTSQDLSTSMNESGNPVGSMSDYGSLPEKKNPEAIDLLYILGRGSKWRNNEIRFSLRSVEKYLPHARVWIIGELPSFLKNVVHVHAIDPYEVKTANAIFKLRAACREIDLSERFILMNDDFFILKHMARVEATHLGNLSDAIRDHSTKTGYYYRGLRMTQDLLVQTGIQHPINYEVHAPMVIEKQKFLDLTDAFDWTEGYLFRSLYGNTYEIGGKKRIDTKVHEISQLETLAKGDILSTADRVVLRPELQHFLYQTFPKPSRYEKPETDPGILP